eukprot:5450514-Amphidinium_carterae.2
MNMIASHPKRGAFDHSGKITNTSQGSVCCIRSKLVKLYADLLPRKPSGPSQAETFFDSELTRCFCTKHLNLQPVGANSAPVMLYESTPWAIHLQHAYDANLTL